LIQQPDEVGVGAIIVNDESGINPIVPITTAKLNRIAVTSWSSLSFKDRDLVISMEQPRTRQS
jgi:hypothetical protein